MVSLEEKCKELNMRNEMLIGQISEKKRDLRELGDKLDLYERERKSRDQYIKDLKSEKIEVDKSLRYERTQHAGLVKQIEASQKAELATS